MSNSTERDRKNERVVRNPTEKVFSPQQLMWINQMYGWIGYQEYVQGDKPARKHALQNVAAALPYVQQDAWHEFEEIQEMTNILPIPPRRDVLYDENLGRALLIVTTAALANRLDDVTEGAIEALVHSPQSFSGELFEKTFEKGRTTEATKGRITYSAMLDSIIVLCSRLGIPNEADTFASIIQAQKSSISRVNKWTKEGDMYSVDEAIESRKNTVGAYYGILARFATPDVQMQTKIRTLFNEIQLDDDMADVEMDLFIQINPFVALLYQEQMLTQYIEEKNNFNDALVRKTLIHMGKKSPQRCGATFKRAIDGAEAYWIKTFLLKHPPLVERYNEVFEQFDLANS